MTPRRRRLLRFLLIALPTLLLLYTLLGFFGVPLLVTKVILPRVSEGLNGEARVKEAYFNPFLLSAALSEFEIVDARGGKLVACERIYANLQVASLWRGGPHFREVRLDKPFLAAEVAQDGRVNLAEIVKEQPDTAEPEDPNAEPWRFSAERFEIRGGRAEFTDRTTPQPFVAVAAPIDVAFEDFDTDPQNNNVHRFTAALESGGTLAWEGDFFLDPLSSEGRITLEGLELAQFRPYLAEATAADLERGLASLTLRYRFAPVKQPRVAEVSLERYALKDVAVSLEGEPLAEVGELAVEGVDADAVERNVAVENVRVVGARLYVEHRPDGTLSIAAAAEAPEGEASEAGSEQSTTEAAREAVPQPMDAGSPITRVVNATIDLLLDALQPWDVSVTKVRFEDAALRIVDRAASTPVEVRVDQVLFEAGPIASQTGFTVPIKLAARVNETGRFAAEGEVATEARAVTLRLDVADLPLAMLSPYLEAALPNSKLTSGALTIKGDIAADAAAGEPRPQLKFDGDVAVTGFRVDGPVEGEPMPAFDAMRLTGVAFDHRERTARVADFAVENLAATYLLVPPMDGSGEGEATSGTQPPPQEAGEPQEPYYQGFIDRLHITTKDLVVVDPSVEPVARTVISDVQATVTGLATAGDTVAAIELAGTLQRESRFAVNGKAAPRFEDPFVDVAVEFDRLPLEPFTGYVGKYVGFAVRSGTLGSNTTVKLERDQVDAVTRLRFQDFHLGEKVESPDAPDAPVKLALSLLRDRQDRINLDVPITGNVSDPTFSVGGVIVQALLNTIVKIAASPFDFIGGVFAGGGGEGEEADGLERIEFAAGEAALTERAAKKLDVLAEALRERPALSLVAHGSTDEAVDTTALKRAALRDEVRRELTAEMSTEEAQAFELTQEDYRRAVQRRYATLTGDEALLAEVTPADPERRMMRGGRRMAGRGAPGPLPFVPDGPAKEAEQDASASPAVPFDQMESTAAEAVAVPPEAIADLSTRRAKAVRTHVTGSGVEPERVSLGETPETTGSVVRLELQ